MIQHQVRRHAPWLALRVLLVLFSTAMLTVAVVSGPGTTQAGAANIARVQTTQTSSDPVILAAGDIACDPTSRAYNSGSGTRKSCQQRWTADELSANAPTVVLPLGDEQYTCGTTSEFGTSYGPTWGQEKAITHPVVGNHEYATHCSGVGGAKGYFTYFGAAATPLQPSCTANCKGYYSYDLGTWHIIALNSECSHIGGCGVGSAEETWLRNDLAAHNNACILAYWHRPYYSAGQSSGDAAMHAFWQDLYNARATIVLNGHDHNYQRFAPQDANGNAVGDGVTEFVVGTGGASHLSFNGTPAHLVVENNTTYGVLKLVLGAGWYSWRFIPDGHSGSFTDSGSASCA